MEISRKLLKKYALGICTEAEHKAVEDWLASDEGFDSTEYNELFESRKEAVRQKLHRRLWFGTTVLGRNSKKLIRFSVAACMLFGAFLGGHASANIYTNKSMRPLRYHEHLYIFGGNGTHGNLPGDCFRVKFDGSLRLYNASRKQKIIISGDSTFLLAPARTYNLTGSTDKPKLVIHNYIMSDDYDENVTRGDFSIVKLDNP